MQPLLSEFNHIHKAIKGELLKLEAHAQNLNPTDPESIGGFAGHFGFIKNVQDAHSHEEENGLWPAIEARMPGTMAPFQMDHDAERVYMGGIQSGLEQLQQPNGDKQAAKAGIYRNAVALCSHLTHHMNKEEALPYTAFSEQLSQPEQLGMITQVLNSLPEELIMRGAPWKASYLTDEEVLEEFDRYQTLISPEKLRVFFAPLATGLPPERWQALMQARPALAQYT